jgi:hypothetical protein
VRCVYECVSGNMRGIFMAPCELLLEATVRNKLKIRVDAKLISQESGVFFN